MTRQKCKAPAGSNPTEASEQTHPQRIHGASLCAADMAREVLIKQLGYDMLPAAKAGDMEEVRRLHDLMFAEIKRRRPQFIEHRTAEINEDIARSTFAIEHHNDRLRAIGGG